MSSPSPPTDELGQLAVSDARSASQSSSMVRTRNQARAQNVREGPISGQKYHLANIVSDDSRMNVEAALTRPSRLNVKRCWMSGNGSKYYFLLTDVGLEATIEVSNTRSAECAPTCTCPAAAPKKACQHVFWLIDRIAEVEGAVEDGQVIKLFESGASDPTVPAMVTRSAIKGLDAVRMQHAWPEDVEIEMDDDDTHANMTALSAFEPNHLFFGSLNSIESLTLVRPFDRDASNAYSLLREMVVGRAFADRGEVLARELRSILPPEFQQRVAFEKYRGQAQQLLGRLDMYSTDFASPALDIVACGEKLIELANRIEAEIETLEDAGKDTKHVVSPLVHILAEVVLHRDIDAYRVVNWHRATPGDESATNLFAHLFLNPEQDKEKPFILAILHDLDEEALRAAVQDDEAEANVLRLSSLMGHIRKRFEQRCPEYLTMVDSILTEMAPTA